MPILPLIFLTLATILLWVFYFIDNTNYYYWEQGYNAGVYERIWEVRLTESQKEKLMKEGVFFGIKFNTKEDFLIWAKNNP